MNKQPIYKDASKSVNARVKDLLKRMTVEEKTYQLIQETIGRDANPNNIGPDNPFNPLVGSILTFGGGAKARNAYQRLAVEKTRLGIPIIWGYDVIHGWKTSMPVSLAQACSFNTALTERLSRVAAEECYNDGGVNWTFSPMVEVSHDPRWGRSVEGYGEDPYTAGEFTAAAVRGYQGRKPEDLARPGHVAACLKHFVGYSASEGGRDYIYTDISNRALWEWYLPPFKAGVAAGARTVMSAFNDMAGTPAVANPYTLKEILRERWGFTGFVVSDWGAVSQLADLHYTDDRAKMTLDTLLAGNEMDMCDGVFKNIPDLVKSGELSMKDLDKAVGRVLRVKFELGLFEHPYTPELPEEKTCQTPAHRQVALEAARETMVLLKNDKKLLPVSANTKKKIAVIGPGADDFGTHLGVWRGMAEKTEKFTSTTLSKIRAFFPKATISYAKGCGFFDDDASGIAEAAKAAANADLVILCVGEDAEQSGEYRSRVDIRLPGRQEELVAAVKAAGKPVVAVVTAGRALVLDKLADCAGAILFAWQSGACAAEAIAEILTGKVNPSGKLSMTFPRHVGQVPVYYNCHPRSRSWARDYTGDIIDYPDGPAYPFGFGLSYTTFEYGEVKIEKKRGALIASVTVTNTGKVAGKEAVLWYLSDLEATYTQPVKRLIGFEKTELEPGESKTLSLELSDEKLAFVTDDGELILEPGEFVISASGKAEAKFTV